MRMRSHGICAHTCRISTDNLDIRQFQGGQSNPTFHLRTARRRIRASQEAAGQAAPPRACGGARAPSHVGVGRQRGPGPPHPTAVYGRLRHRHRLLRHGSRAGPGVSRPGDARWDTGGARSDLRGPCAGARGPASGGLASGGARRFRQARRVYAAPGGVVDTAVGSRTGRGDARDGSSGTVASAAPASGRRPRVSRTATTGWAMC